MWAAVFLVAGSTASGWKILELRDVSQPIQTGATLDSPSLFVIFNDFHYLRRRFEKEKTQARGLDWDIYAAFLLKKKMQVSLRDKRCSLKDSWEEIIDQLIYTLYAHHKAFFHLTKTLEMSTIEKET